jgi:hypothetical protein
MACVLDDVTHLFTLSQAESARHLRVPAKATVVKSTAAKTTVAKAAKGAKAPIVRKPALGPRLVPAAAPIPTEAAYGSLNRLTNLKARTRVLFDTCLVLVFESE